MTFTRDFFTFLTCTAMMTVYHCHADRPPPPTELSYRWSDPFTVRVSWQKPSGVQDGEIWYKYRLAKDTAADAVTCTPWNHFTGTLLTEETGSDHWKYIVWSTPSCESVNNSEPVSIEIQTPRPRAAVQDMRCFFIYPKEMNCSWIPGNQPFNLSYRVCGLYEERIEDLKACHRPYRSATRNGCHLKADDVGKNICVAVDTGAGLSTFKATLEIQPPKLSIREEGSNLVLSWTPPEIGKSCTWMYEVRYKQCDEPKICRNFTTMGDPMKMAYDRRCRYEFQSRVRTTTTCEPVFSDYGDVVSYGTNEPPDGIPLVVAIVIPIILSACIILSCYCLRRHSSIICPIIPDPSTIFKEFMMNGNKEIKPPTGSLYTPIPEPIEPCKITLVTENSVPQQNS